MKVISICFFCVAFCLISCGQEKYSRSTEFFKETEAYELAKAVEDGDLKSIESLVKKDSTLLKVTNPTTGSNVLVLSIYLEKFESFKKLLELGANPNFINPYTRYSVLIESIMPFGNQFEWRKENQYAELLLDYGANPNYALENDFIADSSGVKGLIMATSPLIKASRFDLDLVKSLIKRDADPYRKLGSKQVTPFSAAVESRKIDIINYYIDSLKVDVHQPMEKIIKKSNNKEVIYYIQDYITNKFTKAKIMGDSVKLAELKKKNDGIAEANQELWYLIKKLQKMGVDFKNYDYKK